MHIFWLYKPLRYNKTSTSFCMSINVLLYNSLQESCLDSWTDIRNSNLIALIFQPIATISTAELCCMYTAIPYRASTGPEQGFPCVVFPHREIPVFITGFPGDENRFFPVRKTTQGKPCFHYRDGFAV